MKLPLTKPFITEEEFELIKQPLETGWLVQGPFVKEFEDKIAEFTGAKYAVALNSCTSGQFIMSEIIGVDADDEVILPAFTWISTANSIEYYGGKPVFCDIDIHTFNIDVNRIEAKVSRKTKAIYPVTLFGLTPDMSSIRTLAGENSLKIVEDCACGLGAKMNDTHCGLFGKGGVLSFHPRKSITTGEGGMIITNNERVYHSARVLRDHGAVKNDYERHKGIRSFEMTEYPNLGHNLRMTDLQGAIGVARARVPEYEEVSDLLADVFEEVLFEEIDAGLTYFENEDVILQRIYQNAAGYHADSDANNLRYDYTFQTVLNKDTLASQPTISRVNNKVNKENMKQLQQVNFNLLDKVYTLSPPEEIIFDLDSTNCSTYGQQYGAAYNYHYGANGFHPLLMFDGVTGDLIKAKLRAGNVYTSRKAVRFIGPVFKKYSKKFRKIPLYLRADSGFAKPGIYRMSEEHNIFYTIRLKANAKLYELANPFEEKSTAYESSKITMNRKVAEDYDEWNIEMIEQRTSELAQAMVQIWEM